MPWSPLTTNGPTSTTMSVHIACPVLSHEGRPNGPEGARVGGFSRSQSWQLRQRWKNIRPVGEGKHMRVAKLRHTRIPACSRQLAGSIGIASATAPPQVLCTIVNVEVLDQLFVTQTVHARSTSVSVQLPNVRFRQLRRHLLLEAMHLLLVANIVSTLHKIFRCWGSSCLRWPTAHTAACSSSVDP